MLKTQYEPTVQRYSLKEPYLLVVRIKMTELKVFFADRQTRTDYNMLDKLEHVFNELGLGSTQYELITLSKEKK